MEVLQQISDVMNEAAGSIDNNYVCFKNLGILKFDKPLKI